MSRSGTQESAGLSSSLRRTERQNCSQAQTLSDCLKQSTHGQALGLIKKCPQKSLHVEGSFIGLFPSNAQSVLCIAQHYTQTTREKRAQCA